LWDLFSDDELSANSGDSAGASEESAQLCAFLSEAIVSGVESAHSMHLMGNIPGHQVLVLVDSGSLHSFVSSTMAMRLQVCLCPRPMELQSVVLLSFSKCSGKSRDMCLLEI
jgi:hypothetical protein